MATSLSYNWTSSRNSIIESAFRKIGMLGDFESITDAANAGKLSAGIAALNPMAKTYASKGMHAWTTNIITMDLDQWGGSVTTIPVNSSTAVDQRGGTIGFSPLKAVSAIRRDFTNDVDTEMTPMTMDEYLRRSSKVSTGAPSQYFFWPSTASAYSSSLTIWPLPDVYWQTNGQLLLRVQRPIEDFDSSTDEPDFPKEWHEALIYNLAYRLAPEYGLALNDRLQLKEDAKNTLEEALSFGTEEGSIYIYPETRR